MKRPPRNPLLPLLSRRRILLSSLQGASVASVVLFIYAMALHLGETDTNSRTLAFATLVVGNLMLIFANRSWSQTITATLRAPNPALWWVVGGAGVVLILVIYVPFLQSLFRFSPLHPLDIVICLTGGVTSLLWFEGWKLLRNRFGGSRAT